MRTTNQQRALDFDKKLIALREELEAYAADCPPSSPEQRTWESHRISLQGMRILGWSLLHKKDRNVQSKRT